MHKTNSILWAHPKLNLSKQYLKKLCHSIKNLHLRGNTNHIGNETPNVLNRLIHHFDFILHHNIQNIRTTCYMHVFTIKQHLSSQFLLKYLIKVSFVAQLSTVNAHNLSSKSLNKAIFKYIVLAQRSFVLILMMIIPCSYLF